MLERLLTRDTLLTIGVNIIPLLGALVAGWDAFLLIMFYWLETAVIGFWVCLRVATTAPDPMLSQMAGGIGSQSPNGIGLALFILIHAGIFMAVHLFMLTGFLGDGIPGVMDNPIGFLWRMVLENGMWWPLAGLLVVRGLMTFGGGPAEGRSSAVVIGFYVRIVVMQFTVLLGGWIVLVLLPFGASSPIGVLALLVLIKTIAELQIGRVVELVLAGIAEAAAQRDSSRR